MPRRSSRSVDKKSDLLASGASSTTRSSKKTQASPDEDGDANPKYPGKGKPRSAECSVKPQTSKISSLNTFKIPKKSTTTAGDGAAVLDSEVSDNLTPTHTQSSARSTSSKKASKTSLEQQNPPKGKPKSNDNRKRKTTDNDSEIEGRTKKQCKTKDAKELNAKTARTKRSARSKDDDETDSSASNEDSSDDALMEKNEATGTTKSGKGSQRKSAGSKETPKGKQAKSKQETSKNKTASKPGGKKDSKSSEPKDSNEVLKCHHCDYSNKNMTSMTSHYASMHMLRYTKEKPEGDDTEQASLKAIMRLAGRINCKKCDKRFNNIQYYKLHVKWCGTEDEHKTFQCDICGHDNLKLIWMHQHKLACARNQALKMAKTAAKDSDAIELQSTEKTSARNGKRKAATEAIKLMKSLNDAPAETAEDEDPALSAMYTKPPICKPSQEQIDEWKVQATGDGRAKCSHEGCSFEVGYVQCMIKHYGTCVYNGLESHTFDCLECSKKFTKAQDVIKHINKQHAKKLSKKRKAKDDDYQGGDSESSEESLTSPDQSSESEGAQSDDEKEGSRTRIRAPRSDNRGLEYESYMVRINLSENTRCKLQHSAENYRLPHLNPLPICTVSNHKSSSQKKSLSFSIDGKESVTLEEGSSVTHKNGCITYLGCSIKTVKWCPVETEVKKSAGSQYAACVLNDSELRTTDLYSCPGTIVIVRYTMGKEPKDISTDEVLVISHAFGYIHSIRWCPNGAYIIQNGVERLGLLAVCSSDGLIHVLSGIPGQIELDSGLINNYESVFSPYSIPAVRETKDLPQHVTIDTNGMLNLEVPGNLAQSTCADWQIGDNKFLLGGFNDGSVALWNLLMAQEDTRVLTPIRTFQASTSLITDVLWCPYQKHLFSVTSHGWSVWNMNDLSTSYFTPKLVDQCVDLHLKAAWPKMYPIYVTVTDPSFSASTLIIHSLGYENLYSAQRVPLRDLQIAQDVSICDCKNLIVACDVFGYVTYGDLHFKYTKRTDAKFTKKVALQTKNNDHGTTKFVYNSIEKQPLPGVKGNFCDTQKILENNRMNSINTVSLNPNSSAHRWLLCGGKQGLLHAIYLSH